MKKILVKFIADVVVPILGLVAIFTAMFVLFEILHIKNKPLEAGMIGMGSISLFSIIFGFVRFTKYVLNNNLTKKKLKNFEINSDGSYTCPICSMSNMNFSICERCGFNPETIDNTTLEENNTPKPKKQQPIQKEEKLFCNKCGVQLSLDSSFCHKCGATVSDV